MRIEEEFKIIKKYSGQVSLDALSDAPSLDNRGPYSGLMELLIGEGVDIDESNSEKEISYDIKGMEGVEKRKSRVPLHHLSEDLKVVGYIFRTSNLELTINDYGECSGTDLDGGSVTAMKGVHCKICFKGDFEGRAIVERVERVSS